MLKALPQLPNVEHLRKQAKDLLALHRAHDPRAAVLLRALHPSFANAHADQVFHKGIHLSDAQLVVARQHGFQSWPQMKTHIDLILPHACSNGVLVDQDKISNPEYRHSLGARKGLPAVGSSHISQFGVEYDVVDHSFVLSFAGASRAAAQGLTWQVEELLPRIVPKNVSPRLKALFDEVDRCTGKDLIFFDTMADAFPGHAPQGFNCAMESNTDSRAWAIHLDAARIHETIIAHELAHIRIGVVDGCEDYRLLKDVSNLRNIVQFQHLQSFVLDLKVNNLLQELGFDLSIINNDQLESVRAITEHCARGNSVRTARAAMGLVNALAAVMLEQQRYPRKTASGLEACFAVIEACLPEIYHLAESYVSIVLKYGYSNGASIRKIIDECAVLSFNATGGDFDLARDLVEVPSIECMRDKKPDFLPGLPVSVKLDVWRSVARHKIGSPLVCTLIPSPSGRLVIKLSDGSGVSNNSAEVSCYLPPTMNSNPSRVSASARPSHVSMPVAQRQDLQLAYPGNPVVPTCFSGALVPPNRQSNPLWPIPPSAPKGWNYMAGVGLWLSRAAFEDQAAGEHPYSYAWNDPVNYVDPEGLWPETGTATCFDDSELFCNHDPSNPHCPKYSHGMTGAWPNVNQIKIRKCCGTDSRQYNSGLSESVDCGSQITVSKGSCSVTITIIDAGPNSTAASSAIVDLSPKAAKALWTCLHPTKKPTKPPTKGKPVKKPHFSCGSFEVDEVTVNG